MSVRESKDQMQGSGGALLAAGLDGGNTIIFLFQREEKCKRSRTGHHEK